jgi:hypothetical protein
MIVVTDRKRVKLYVFVVNSLFLSKILSYYDTNQVESLEMQSLPSIVLMIFLLVSLVFSVNSARMLSHQVQTRCGEIEGSDVCTLISCNVFVFKAC